MSDTILVPKDIPDWQNLLTSVEESVVGASVGSGVPLEVQSVTYDSDGVISTADITWPDGTNGAIKNVDKTDLKITSITYEYGANAEIQVDITYNSDGSIATISKTKTGF